MQEVSSPSSSLVAQHSTSQPAHRHSIPTCASNARHRAVSMPRLAPADQILHYSLCCRIARQPTRLYTYRCFPGVLTTITSHQSQIICSCRVGFPDCEFARAASRCCKRMPVTTIIASLRSSLALQVSVPQPALDISCWDCAPGVHTDSVVRCHPGAKLCKLCSCHRSCSATHRQRSSSPPKIGFWIIIN